jgi:acetamidase/formamidase
MRFIRCGSKLFRPDAVTAVHLDRVPSSAGPTEVWVVVPGDILVFRGDEAKAVRQYFGCLPATDLLRRDEEAPEAVADNHLPGEC